MIVSHAAPGIGIDVFNIFRFTTTLTPLRQAMDFFFPARAVVVASVVARLEASGTPTDIRDSELPGIGRCIKIPSGLLISTSASTTSSSLLIVSEIHSGGGPRVSRTASIRFFSAALICRLFIAGPLATPAVVGVEAAFAAGDG